MRRASELEQRRLGETFARLCSITSPSGSERGVADYLISELGAMGIEVAEDDSADRLGGDCGNLFARVGPTDAPQLLLCAHMDTVGDDRPVDPVFRDGGWESSDEAILGADNKAAVAVIVELARRVAIEGAPVGVELCFTVREEQALLGAYEIETGRFKADFGYVFDHATPIGEVIAASPTYVQWEAVLEGRAAHAGISPEDGRNAIVAAARAVSRIPSGRIDGTTTANVASITGGVATHGTNIVAPDCRVAGEARSLEDGVAERLGDEVVEAFHDAANEPDCSCDVDVTLERSFEGYRVDPDEPGAKVAVAALQACGHEPRLVESGGGSDANAFRSAGMPVINIANGTERPHMPDERVSAEALEQMLDVVIALSDEAGEQLR